MGLGYMENLAPADINNGLIKTPMKIDHHRSLLDRGMCQTFTSEPADRAEEPRQTTGSSFEFQRATAIFFASFASNSRRR